MAFSKINRLRRHDNAQVLSGQDHVRRRTPSMSPRRAALISIGIRTTSPPVSMLIVALQTGDVSCGSPTTNLAKGTSPAAGKTSRPSRARRRHPVRCCGVRPWRRATALTFTPVSKLSDKRLLESARGLPSKSVVELRSKIYGIWSKTVDRQVPVEISFFVHNDWNGIIAGELASEISKFFPDRIGTEFAPLCSKFVAYRVS